MENENKPTEKRKRGNPNWVKGGASPNAGGRPKSVKELLEAFRADVPKAQQLCRAYLNDKQADARVRLEAAKLVLTYGLGKPPTVELPKDDGLKEKSTEELLAELDSLRGGNAPSTTVQQ